MSDKSNIDMLMEKWEPMLSNEKVDKIVDINKTKITAQLLENQEAFLNEAANVSADMVGWTPTIISMVRRMAPKLLAYDICGVQALNMPTGRIFALRARYNDAASVSAGTEANFGEANTAFSGTGTHAGSDPFTQPDAAVTTGTGKSTAAGEVDAWNSMGVTIESVDVSTKTRQLRADYSLELAQDMRAVHGLDADAELAAILSNQVVSELNREIVRTTYGIAKMGAQFATAPGVYDLAADSDGRWAGERYSGLLFAIERDANAIGLETRLGKGNIIITSADVASALVMAKLLSYNSALDSVVNLEVDTTGPTFAGTMGRFKVFVDPYLSQNGYVVGYRGSNAYDAGFFYCPYVPLQMVRAVDPVNFHPAMGFKTRYGLVSNPFTTMTHGANTYFRKAKITNLR